MVLLLGGVAMLLLDCAGVGGYVAMLLLGKTWWCWCWRMYRYAGIIITVVLLLDYVSWSCCWMSFGFVCWKMRRDAIVGGDVAVGHTLDRATQRSQGMPRFAGCLVSWGARRVMFFEDTHDAVEPPSSALFILFVSSSSNLEIGKCLGFEYGFVGSYFVWK